MVLKRKQQANESVWALQWQLYAVWQESEREK